MIVELCPRSIPLNSLLIILEHRPLHLILLSQCLIQCNFLRHIAINLIAFLNYTCVFLCCLGVLPV
jgi:hypothetical protein